MKLLPDSNIFIDYWENKRGSADELKAVFENEEIYLCGVVKAELLHGAFSEKHLHSMGIMLDAFESLNLDAPDWQTLGENLYKLRTHGITVPFSDAMIASIAIKYDIPVWTRDNHFKLIRKVLGNLKLKE